MGLVSLVSSAVVFYEDILEEAHKPGQLLARVVALGNMLSIAISKSGDVVVVCQCPEW